MIDYNEERKDLQIDRNADDFCVWVDEQAAKLEITCDYYLAEFL